MSGYKFLTCTSKVNSYIPVPMKLLRSKLGSTTLLVYGLLLGRATLSQKNNWTDDSKRIFIIYPISQISADVGKSLSVVKHCLKELETEGLLVRQRTGFNKPNHLLVRVPEECLLVQKQNIRKPDDKPSSGWNSGF
ncbi:MAG: replication initiator protein A [Lachnospiraceae bacterium]|nr:replication initiator protein A [Lachnospiraceae bacterium]MDD3616996.1 replication initiator protein A [Lachnospiraceae bacterium]NCB93665.1 hypothetical protein [Clostridia bacterium]